MTVALSDRFFPFQKDSRIAHNTEIEIAQKIKSVYGVRKIEFNRTSDYDLKVFTKKGTIIFVEIKEDFTCKRTGNIGVEFECRGKPSGISISKSSHYLFKVHTNKGIRYFIVETSVLKEMIEKKMYFTIVNGGDVGSNSMNYLFKLDVISKNSREIFQ